MYLIVGLGNPGLSYEFTRHNAGFLAVDLLAETLNTKLTKLKFKSLYGSVRINSELCYLIKPQTYMNLSGYSVREWRNFLKVDIKNIIIIFDDTDTGPGVIRIRHNGSAGGHNGIKSIIENLGTDDFPRVKIGIGAKPPHWDLADYVVSKMSESEFKMMAPGIKDAAKAVPVIVSDGIEKAMNIYNGKATNQ